MRKFFYQSKGFTTNGVFLSKCKIKKNRVVGQRECVILKFFKSACHRYIRGLRLSVGELVDWGILLIFAKI